MALRLRGVSRRSTGFRSKLIRPSRGCVHLLIPICTVRWCDTGVADAAGAVTVRVTLRHPSHSLWQERLVRVCAPASHLTTPHGLLTFSLTCSTLGGFPTAYTVLSDNTGPEYMQSNGAVSCKHVAVFIQLIAPPAGPIARGLAGQNSKASARQSLLGQPPHEVPNGCPP